MRETRRGEEREKGSGLDQPFEAFTSGTVDHTSRSGVPGDVMSTVMATRATTAPVVNVMPTIRMWVMRCRVCMSCPKVKHRPGELRSRILPQGLCGVAQDDDKRWRQIYQVIEPSDSLRSHEHSLDMSSVVQRLRFEVYCRVDTLQTCCH